jgi:hypothetical protein
MNFRQFLESKDLGLIGQELPDTSLVIPTVTIKSEIQSIRGDKPRPGESPKNPIEIRLKNGSNIFFSYDQYKRIKSKINLEKGKEISVTYRRNQSDKTTPTSSIINIT